MPLQHPPGSPRQPKVEPYRRILLGLPPATVEQLDRLVALRRAETAVYWPRNDVIRQAIAAYLAILKTPPPSAPTRR